MGSQLDVWTHLASLCVGMKTPNAAACTAAYALSLQPVLYKRLELQQHPRLRSVLDGVSPGRGL